MTRPRPRPWQAVLGASTLLAIPVLVLPPGIPSAVAFLTGAVVLAAGLVAAARSLQPGERRAWIPWIIGVSCALVGYLPWSATTLLGMSATIGNLAVPLWAGVYLWLAVAIIRMIRKRALPRAERVALVKDVAVVVAAATVFAWHVLIEPVVVGDVTADEWALVAGFCYPLGDITVLALGLTLLLTPGRPSTSERLMLGSFAGCLTVDIAQVLVPIVAPELGYAWYMPGYMIINAMMAAAVLHPSRSRVTEPIPRAGGTAGMRGWRMILLGSALSAVGLSVTLMPHSGWNRLPTAAAMLIMIAVILSRLQRAVSDLAGAEQTMRHQATHDQLTGVANRARLMDEMRHAVTKSPTLFFVDLDGFKAINDTRGHHTGDIVLKVVAERLTGIVRSTDSVARLGGDEFVVVCTGLDPDEVTALATRIERTLSSPIATDDDPVTVGSSIGILTLPYADSTYDASAADDLISDLLRTADAAMYEAKRDGGGTKIVEYALSA